MNEPSSADEAPAKKGLDQILDEHIEENYPDYKILKCDGFDACIVGISQVFGGQPILTYDSGMMVEQLVNDGMTYEDAIEYFDFNIGGAYMGPGTPTFLSRIPELDAARDLEREEPTAES